MHGQNFYDTQKEYRRNMLAKWNVHNEQVLRMMKKAVSFRPIVDIQKFITENICDIPDKPNIELMQQNIRIINGTNCWRSVSRKSWMRCSKSAGCIRR